MHDRLIFTTLLCAFLAGCATAERIVDGLDDSDFVTADFVKAWARAERQTADPMAQDYLAKRSYVQSPLDKIVHECTTNVFPEIETAAVVLRIDFSGVVVNSVTDQSGYIAECIPRKAHGLRMSPPPATGFLVCGRYTRLSASEYALAGCGPGHLRQICKRVGTITTCERQRAD